MRKNCLLLFIAALLITSCSKKTTDYDIIVYGGSSAGVMAACSADREGKKVLLIEPGGHLGGLSSGGLGQTDIGNKHAVTGMSRDFYRRLGKKYNKLEAWKFEPHAAESVFNDFIKESEVDVLFGYHVLNVTVKNRKIRKIEVGERIKEENTKFFKASCFIDCSYEGDLMARAGVSFTVGRESNDLYGETYNGFQLRNEHQFPDYIDPYLIPGDPESGLCPGIQDGLLRETGSGDELVQAYNYRLCLTNDRANRIAFSIPEGYDPGEYELLARLIEYHEKSDPATNRLDKYLIISPMPNRKTDINNKGAFSTDAIGMNRDYPLAGYERREEIALEVENYIKGLLYFLANDPRVTENIRNEMNTWGWAADEFADNGHFPHQMYVREARRMTGEYVMTEHNCTGDSLVEDGIGLAAYTMDSHNCQRLVVNGMVKNEGDVQIGGFPPYQIAYRSLVPKRTECTNLSVPVCLSSSHIAFGSIRMEPVFMVLGQVCGLASSMAIEGNKAIQDVNVSRLAARLKEDPLQNGTLPEMVIDNSDSVFIGMTGEWEIKETWMGQYKSDHLIWLPGNKASSFTFKPGFREIPWKYHAYLYVPAKRWEGESFSRFAENVKVEVRAADRISVGKYNFEAAGFDWLDIGEYTFKKGNYIRIYADDNDFPVTADALLLVPVSSQ